MAHNNKRLLVIWLMALLLAGCGAASGNLIDNSASIENGRRIFHGEAVLEREKLDACTDCHTTDIGVQPSLGLNMSNIGNRAATRVPDQSAEDYIRTSITDPDAFLAGGFQEGIMPRYYAERLTPQQIDDLVLYLMSLKSGQD